MIESARIQSTHPIQSTLNGPNRRADPYGLLDLTAVGSLDGLLPCWWAAVELRPWRAQEVADMGVGYPSFTSVVRRSHRPLPGRVAEENARARVEREECGEFVLAWQGSIAPFPVDMSLEEIQAILADLDEDQDVRVLVGGALAHYDGCAGSHRPRRELRLARALLGSFRVEIAYRRPPGCPVSRSLSPRIDQHHASGPPPHLLNSIDALCVIFPADGNWTWGVHGARQYTNFTAIWLAKHLAWVEARERGVGVEEAWPGSTVDHDPSELLRLLGRRDLCRCGSGKEYGSCCRKNDESERLVSRKVGGLPGRAE